MRPYLLFIILALLTLTPFRTSHEFISSHLVNQVAAGQFVDGTRVIEKGHVPSSKALGTTKQHLCFGIQFATYARQNEGYLTVVWNQGESRGHWQLHSASLADNRFRYFCPDKGILLDTDYDLSISSTGAHNGKAPTAWLTSDTRFGQVSINGVAQKTSLVLSFATHRVITLHHIVALDHGAYFFGWLMSIVIGLAALALSTRQGRPQTKPDKLPAGSHRDKSRITETQ